MLADLLLVQRLRRRKLFWDRTSCVPKKTSWSSVEWFERTNADRGPQRWRATPYAYRSMAPPACQLAAGGRHPSSKRPDAFHSGRCKGVAEQRQWEQKPF